MINIISTILSLIAAAVFLRAAMSIGGQMRKAYTFISIGIIIAITVHSVVELLEAYKLVDNNFLHVAMPVLISIGAIFFIAGAFITIDAVRPSKASQSS